MSRVSIPKLGEDVYPEEYQKGEEFAILLIRFLSILFCLAFWFGIYKLCAAFFL